MGVHKSVFSSQTILSSELLKMKVLKSIAVLAVLLAVVAGQNKCHWGAPFGCPTKDKVCTK